MPVQTRTCSTCGKEKPATREHFFYVIKTLGLLNQQCIECSRKHAAESELAAALAQQDQTEIVCRTCHIAKPKRPGIFNYRRKDLGLFANECADCRRTQRRDRRRAVDASARVDTATVELARSLAARLANVERVIGRDDLIGGIPPLDVIADIDRRLVNLVRANDLAGGRLATRVAALEEQRPGLLAQITELSRQGVMPAPVPLEPPKQLTAEEIAASDPLSTERTVPLRVYFAGKIAKNDWRGVLVGRNPVDVDDFEFETRHSNALMSAPGPVPVNGIPLMQMTGPFFIGDDHGCWHGENTHGLAADGRDYMDGDQFPDGVNREQAVVRACDQWIRAADCVFVWLDDDEAYGTIAEIGMAAAYNKPIFLYAPQTPSRAFRNLAAMWFVRALAKDAYGGEGGFFHATTVADALADFVARFTADRDALERFTSRLFAWQVR